MQEGGRVSPQATLLEKKKKEGKRGKKKEKRKKSRGIKERKLGRELEMKTKRSIQCSESPSKHPVCYLDGDKQSTPRQQPALDVALEPALSSRVLLGSPAKTSFPTSPGKREAREGCPATKQTRKEAWLAKTANFSFSLAVQLGSPLVYWIGFLEASVVVFFLVTKE